MCSCDTKEMALKLKAGNMNIFKWFVDASCGVHGDMRGHTGGCSMLEKGAVIGQSSKQKSNAKSTTETELVAVDDMMAHISWTNHFAEWQGCKS